MPRVIWLIAVVVLGVAVMSTLLMLPPQGPGEVDHPDTAVAGPPLPTTGMLIAATQCIGGREELTGTISSTLRSRAQ